MKRAIILLTGPDGAAQGWGGDEVTATLAAVLRDWGREVRTVEVATAAELHAALSENNGDLVWSALYSLDNPRRGFTPQSGALDVFKWLETRGFRTIGSSAQAQITMLDKAATHARLRQQSIPTPQFMLYSEDTREAMVKLDYPLMVKPNNLACSLGISQRSVVANFSELREVAQALYNELGEAVLLEEFLPGREYTVLLLNGRFYVGEVVLPEAYRGKYRVLGSNLRGVGLTRIMPVAAAVETEAVSLAAAAAAALGARDCVRFDLRTDSGGALRIMEANGIPGMNREHSWAPQLYGIYHPNNSLNENFGMLVSEIVASAEQRYDMEK